MGNALNPKRQMNLIYLGQCIYMSVINPPESEKEMYYLY